MTTDIRAIVDRFVEDITAAIQSSAREALQSALGGNAAVRKGPGRVAKAAAPARGRGAKRAPEELEALVGKLRTYVAKNPGQRTVGARTRLREALRPSVGVRPSLPPPTGVI
jgi:hypothetical protein